MLYPKKVKFKVMRKPRLGRGVEKKSVYPTVGIVGLKVLESVRLSSRQLKALKDGARKLFKKYAKIWLVIFPDKSVTKKPGESRMGKGKGGHFEWVALVLRGSIILEVGVSTLSVNRVILLLKKVQVKLGIKTEVILRKF